MKAYYVLALLIVSHVFAVPIGDYKDLDPWDSELEPLLRGFQRFDVEYSDAAVRFDVDIEPDSNDDVGEMANMNPSHSTFGPIDWSGEGLPDITDTIDENTQNADLSPKDDGVGSSKNSVTHGSFESNE